MRRAFITGWQWMNEQRLTSWLGVCCGNAQFWFIGQRIERFTLHKLLSVNPISRSSVMHSWTTCVLVCSCLSPSFVFILRNKVSVWFSRSLQDVSVIKPHWQETKTLCASSERSHHSSASYIMYSPMSRVPAPAGDPWWLPYESVLLAHLTQPFQLHLHQLPVYWTLTERCETRCYWKGFVIWEIAGDKAQKPLGVNYVSYRFRLHGATGAERPCVISCTLPPCRDCAVCWCCSVLTHWGAEHILTFSPRLLSPAISCEIWEDPPPPFSGSLSLCRADLCSTAGKVWFNLHCNMSRSRASPLKLQWSAEEPSEISVWREKSCSSFTPSPWTASPTFIVNVPARLWIS